MMAPLRFRARVISGSGRGKTLRVPTLNLDLRDVPRDLPEGVFACRAIIDGTEYLATAHHGPRPTFGDSPSFEVHLIGTSLTTPPELVEVEIVQLLRGISKFSSGEELSEQMRKDIEDASYVLLRDARNT